MVRQGSKRVPERMDATVAETDGEPTGPPGGDE